MRKAHHLAVSILLLTGIPQTQETRYAPRFTGSDGGARLAACMAALGAVGGTCDARRLTGVQRSAANPFAQISAPVKLLLGDATFIVQESWALPSGSSIEGIGPESVIKLADGVNGKYVVTNADPAEGNHGLTLRNLRIDGNRAQQSPTGTQRTGGLRYSRVSDFSIFHVEVVEAYHHGIQIVNGSSGGHLTAVSVRGSSRGSGIILGSRDTSVADIILDKPEVHDVSVANCIFVIGSDRRGSYGTRQIIINDPKTDSCGDVDIEIGESAQNVIVNGGSVNPAGKGRSGVMVRSARNVTVNGTFCYGSGSPNEDCFFIWSETGDYTLAANIILNGTHSKGAGRSAYYVAAAAEGAVDAVVFNEVEAHNSGASEFVISANATNVLSTSRALVRGVRSRPCSRINRAPP